jgi:anaerobic selenocysteine-containing dehydrogenase
VTQTRREFLWAAGAATSAWALLQAQGIEWTAEQVAEAGWAPGVEARLASTCLLCPARCGIQGRLVDGKLVRIIGNPLHPMSRGGVCPRGIGGVQILYHPDRLKSPLARVGPRGSGQWRPISPPEAVALLADRLQALRTAGRPEALALLAGYCAGTTEDLWRQFLRAFGSPNYLADDYNDGTDAVMALMHGIPRRPGYDLERAGLVLSFGAPLFEAWWSPLQAYVAFGGPAPEGRAGGERPRAPRFIQVDTRFSRTAARAHEWVGVRPGTHGALALGIAYVLIKEELFDAGFVAEYVSGFEDQVEAGGRVREGYRSLVLRHYRTEEASAITGVPVERIVTLAKSLAERRPAVAVCGADVLRDSDGLLGALAVHSLNVLMGSINRPGGVLFGDDPPLEPLVAVTKDAIARAGLAAKPLIGSTPPFGAGDPARQFAEAVAQSATPPVEALLLYYANPIASSTHPEAWTAALSRIPFVVSFSPFLDESARQADLVLPDLLPYERWQDAPVPASHPYPVWGLARPLLEPQGAGGRGMATGDAVLALAQRLGGTVGRSLPYATMEELLKARARRLFGAGRGMALGSEFERTHYRQMEERGWWLAEHSEFDAFWQGLVDRGGWTDLFHDQTDPARLAQTPNGRIALMPDALREALAAEGRTPSPYPLPSPASPAPPAEFPLRLIPYRISTLASGTLALEPWLAEQPTIFPDAHWVPWVEVHPRTAEALGIDDGAMVRVVSARSRYRARLKVFPGTALDNLNAPYGLRHPDGELANPLQLLDGSTDPLTGITSWFSTFVRLERA